MPERTESLSPSSPDRGNATKHRHWRCDKNGAEDSKKVSRHVKYVTDNNALPSVTHSGLDSDTTIVRFTRSSGTSEVENRVDSELPRNETKRGRHKKVAKASVDKTNETEKDGERRIGIGQLLL